MLAFKGDKPSLNPLDLAQWEFYVVATKEIDRAFGEREYLLLPQVRELSRAYAANDIAQAVAAAYTGRH